VRKADFQKRHRGFEAWLYLYAQLTKRLIEAQRVVKDKCQKLELVEALVLRCATRWEVLLVEDIITSINRDSSAYANALGLRLRKHLSFDECEAIVLGQRYLDFKSVGDAKTFGRKYLVDKYNPFKAISSNHAKKIDEFMVIRNYLAHYSSSSRRAYRNMMKRNHNYSRVPDAGDFLIKINPRTRLYKWGDYLMTMTDCSKTMRGSVV
jgi:hypothetical protein